MKDKFEVFHLFIKFYRMIQTQFESPFFNMVSESFRAYPNKYLLGLSGHPLSGRYRTTHNI